MQTGLKVLLTLCCGWLYCPAVLAEQVIYQWRDSNNVLHVSQLPPANVDYQTIVLGAKSAAATTTVPEQSPAKSSPDYAQSCTKAQDNLRILQQDLPVYIDMEDGTKELLDDTKRDQQNNSQKNKFSFTAINLRR